MFNVYEGLLDRPPDDKPFGVTLLADPAVRTSARVREVAPIVDARTGALQVRATLQDVPARMTLGATVLGTGNLDAQQAVVLPWSALFRWQRRPAVWIVEPDGTVAVRPVTVEAYIGRDLVLKDGVAAGEWVVTAGIQFLHPGSEVEVVGEGDP